MGHESPYASVRYHHEPLKDSWPIAIEDAQLIHCRWIVTENGVEKFCGLDKAATGSFCDHHHKLAYVKEPPRPHRANRGQMK